jgi:hypothetical protein
MDLRPSNYRCRCRPPCHPCHPFQPSGSRPQCRRFRPHRLQRRDLTTVWLRRHRRNPQPEEHNQGSSRPPTPESAASSCPACKNVPGRIPRNRWRRWASSSRQAVERKRSTLVVLLGWSPAWPPDLWPPPFRPPRERLAIERVNAPPLFRECASSGVPKGIHCDLRSLPRFARAVGLPGLRPLRLAQ